MEVGAVSSSTSGTGSKLSVLEELIIRLVMSMASAKSRMLVISADMSSILKLMNVMVATPHKG